jgi:hypothetical protein
VLVPTFLLPKSKVPLPEIVRLAVGVGDGDGEPEDVPPPAAPTVALAAGLFSEEEVPSEEFRALLTLFAEI